MTDSTHDPGLACWVNTANGHDQFPIQNLPLGIFSRVGERRRGGVAIGDSILDLSGVRVAGLLKSEAAEAAEAASGMVLNPLLELGGRHRAALRMRLCELLSDPGAEAHLGRSVYAAGDCTLHVPAAIGDYTDFYAGIHHAAAVGALFRPDAPLLPNYKYMPIAYHGRASSVRASGFPVRRPRGQIKLPSMAAPSYEPTGRLDFELELGVWVGPGTELGTPVPIGQAHRHIAGYCLLNDWSARDIQAWEYQPLGPFLAKNFMTTISPWIVTPEALEPFRVRQPTRPAGDPRPLPHLWDETDQAQGAIELDLEVSLATETMRRSGTEPVRIATANAQELYWTAAQMLCHHTSGGCDLRAGDLLGSGTISNARDGRGSLLELSKGGADPILLPNGERRTFLLDGDEVILKAHAHREGFRSIGFGECRGAVAAN